LSCYQKTGPLKDEDPDELRVTGVPAPALTRLFPLSLNYQPYNRRLAGILILLCGLLMLLPLPLPFSNSLPALTILLLAAGALERDGVFFLTGCGVFLVTTAYFLILALGGAHLVDDVLHKLTGQ
jgi:hypothetical protein